MKLKHYAFLLKADGYDPAKHRAQIDCEGFASTIVCVSTVEEAIAAARHMVAGGVQLIELCGGFSSGEASQVIAGIDGAAPVGHVAFSPKETQRLEAFLVR